MRCVACNLKLLSSHIPLKRFASLLIQKKFSIHYRIEIGSIQQTTFNHTEKETLCTCVEQPDFWLPASDIQPSQGVCGFRIFKKWHFLVLTANNLLTQPEQRSRLSMGLPLLIRRVPGTRNGRRCHFFYLTIWYKNNVSHPHMWYKT